MNNPNPKFINVENDERIKKILPFGTTFTAAFGNLGELIYSEETNEFLTPALLEQYGDECLPKGTLDWLAKDELFITFEPHHSFDNLDELLEEIMG
jgi:hypothetical protein